MTVLHQHVVKQGPEQGSQSRPELWFVRTFVLVKGCMFVCMPKQNPKSKVFNYSNYVAVLAIKFMHLMAGDTTGQFWWQCLVESSIQNYFSFDHWTSLSSVMKENGCCLLSYRWRSREGPAGQEVCSYGSRGSKSPIVGCGLVRLWLTGTLKRTHTATFWLVHKDAFLTELLPTGYYMTQFHGQYHLSKCII